MELLEIGTSDSICKSITYCNDNMVGLTKVKCRVLPNFEIGRIQYSGASIEWNKQVKVKGGGF